MDPFTADYLANLTADLTALVLEGAGRRLGQALAGTEEQQALRPGRHRGPGNHHRPRRAG
jgi:hypothetical protein